MEVEGEWQKNNFLSRDLDVHSANHNDTLIFLFNPIFILVSFIQKL